MTAPDDTLRARLAHRHIARDELDAERMRREVHGYPFGDKPEPVTIDRFVIAHTLGSGGMGVVSAAYDPRGEHPALPRAERTRATVLLAMGRPADAEAAVEAGLAAARRIGDDAAADALQAWWDEVEDAG